MEKILRLVHQRSLPVQGAVLLAEATVTKIMVERGELVEIGQETVEVLGLTAQEQMLLSPMMKQYVEIKRRYSDYVVFFRVGDFYEMFFTEAEEISKLIGLTLTRKSCGLSEDAAMCGIPHVACDEYVGLLIEKGKKVAICEQVQAEDSRGGSSAGANTKGLMEREVVSIITPGTVVEPSLLEDSSNNYLTAVYVCADGRLSLAFADVSTGEVFLQQVDNIKGMFDVLQQTPPAEMLLHVKVIDLVSLDHLQTQFKHCSYTILDDEAFGSDNDETIKVYFADRSYESVLGVVETSELIEALRGLFHYINRTVKGVRGRFAHLQIREIADQMLLDTAAIRNLEIFKTLITGEREGSLLSVLDRTSTTMGKRLLKSWLERPLVNPKQVIERLNAVEELVHCVTDAENLSSILRQVCDLSRQMTRVVCKTATPQTLQSLSRTLKVLPEIRVMLGNKESTLLRKYQEDICDLSDICNLLDNALGDNPPANLRSGGVIREGYSQELDDIRAISQNGANMLQALEGRERSATGIKNLRVSYNKNTGYCIEVTKSNYDKVPKHYIRRLTLTNSERYITDELKDIEHQILNANDRIINLESEIFDELLKFVAGKLLEIQSTADSLASVDVISSFARLAIDNNYIKPQILLNGRLVIQNGRHPMVEVSLRDELFVPNDLSMDLEENRFILLTGPNMSGKSTYMRQTALIVLMAQIGCFVPADYAEIGIIDQLFTRIGASDDLTGGRSTFMVEMSEMANILKSATKRSLVLLDEVGRGTATFDGMSIAQAIVEYMINKRQLGCKTLFATHYHELTGLSERYDGIKNFRVAVNKVGGEIRFLRKIASGCADESYGIDVAKLAGMPKKIIKRASEILCNLEEHQKLYMPETDSETIKKAVETEPQMSFEVMSMTKVLKNLHGINVDELSNEQVRELLKVVILSVENSSF